MVDGVYRMRFLIATGDSHVVAAEGMAASSTNGEESVANRIETAPTQSRNASLLSVFRILVARVTLHESPHPPS